MMRWVQGESLAETDPKAPSESPGRWATVVLLLLVLIPSAFNAKALLPELSLSIPNLNDGAVHYLLVQRASEALASGENPVDHWVPELELGFPLFFYYQHLPHLAVVLLHRLLLQQVDLLTLFNLIRYLLLLGFPLTVYWSLRRLGFSVVAGAVAAAASSLLSSNHGYGFEYGSYIWGGHGMYTQLWAMHLSFLTLACLERLLERGEGYVAAVLASSLLALSHLIYAYMMAPAVIVLFLMGLNRANARPRLARLAVTGALAALITAYFWFPFLLHKAYLSASPYLQRWKYDSFGAGDILTWLLNGELLDHGRLPVLTVLLALGVTSALVTRTRPARLALVLFPVWLVFYFGRPTWGRLADLLPMHEGLLFHRFIGGVHLAALLLIGLGGEWIWRQVAPLPERWRAMTLGLVLLVLLVPALRERHADYALNTQWMERTKTALDADGDARTILAMLKELPPGRAYAGLRANWGEELQFGGLHFYNLLTFYRIAAVSPPYSSLSLNADLIWHFDDQNPAHYNLFNVRYVVAPHGLAMPAFLRRIKETPRYSLYQAETSGYAQFAALNGTNSISSQSSLFSQNRNWLLSPEPAAGRFIRYDSPADRGGSESPVKPGCPGGGTISEERVLPGRIDLRVECQQAATLVLKVTYHPNWRVAIDGHEARPFMLSPSFIGLDVPTGLHHIRAEYRSPAYKTALLLLGACTLVAMLLLRHWFARLDELFFSSQGLQLEMANKLTAPSSLKYKESTRTLLQGFVCRFQGKASACRFDTYIDALGTCCALMIATALGILAVRSVVRLEPRWDTFDYHIPFAALRGGLGIPYEMNDRMQDRYAGFPPLPDLVQGMLWRLTGSVNATGIVNYLAFSIFLVFCHVKLRARFWLVAMIALTAPLVLIHTTVSYVDLFGNSFLAMGISSFVYMYLFDQYHDRSLLVHGLLGLIAAAWSKYLLVPLTAVFLVAFALMYLCAAHMERRIRFQLLGLVVMATFLAAVPYFKNLAVHKNPFWPLKMPIAGELFPYKVDPQVSALEQKPPPLVHLSQFELFFHSLFEINHPTSYEHRPRWIIDQGNAWLAFRMGGFWNISVVIYLLASVAMAFLFNVRKGMYLVGAGALLVCLLAVLPQSHELRYYLFLPLCWAAIVGMLFPHIRQKYQRTTFCCVLLFAGLFLYMCNVNRTYYRIEKIDYLAAANRWGASQWWEKLKPGVKYCVVDMEPIGIMMTGPTMREFYIIDRSDERLCPGDSVIIRKGELPARS